MTMASLKPRGKAYVKKMMRKLFFGSHDMLLTGLSQLIMKKCSMIQKPYNESIVPTLPSNDKGRPHKQSMY